MVYSDFLQLYVGHRQAPRRHDPLNKVIDICTHDALRPTGLRYLEQSLKAAILRRAMLLIIRLDEGALLGEESHLCCESNGGFIRERILSLDEIPLLM